MLSAETAVGEYPIESVAMMDRIARRVQEDPLYLARCSKHPHRAGAHRSRCDQRRRLPGRGHGRCGGDRLLHNLGRHRFARRARAPRRADPGADGQTRAPPAGSLLLWGAHCVHTSDVKNFTDMVQKAARMALARNRRTRPAGRRHRRSSVWHSRRHQHSADRLGRSLKRTIQRGAGGRGSATAARLRR